MLRPAPHPIQRQRVCTGGHAAATSSVGAIGVAVRRTVVVANYEEARRIQAAIMAEKSRDEAERQRRRSSSAW
jgi:hypothetical protein